MKRMGRKGSLLALGLGAALLVSAIPAVAAPLNTEGSWKQDAGQWSFVKPDGSKYQGWIYTDGSWFFLKEDGTLFSGWQKNDAGKWFFMSTLHDGTFGKLLQGWQWVGGYSYYLQEEEGPKFGELLVSSEKDGYKVDAEGYWVNADGTPVYEAGKGYPSVEQKQSTEEAASTTPTKTIISFSGGGSGSGSGGAGGASGKKNGAKASSSNLPKPVASGSNLVASGSNMGH